MKNMKEGNYIYFKDIYRGDRKKQIDDYQVFMYTTLQMSYNFALDGYDLILNTIYLRYNISRSVQGKLRTALLELEQNNLITIEILDGTDKIGKNTPLFITVNKELDNDDYYTLLNNSSVHSILQNSKDFREQSNMLAVYSLLSLYIGKRGYAYPSMERMSDDLDTHINTIASSIDRLVELDIVLKGNLGGIRNKQGQFKALNNIYVLNEMAGADEFLHHTVTQYREKFGASGDKGESNKKASVTQRLNKFYDRLVAGEKIMQDEYMELEKLELAHLRNNAGHLTGEIKDKLYTTIGRREYEILTQENFTDPQ